jgi:hypothetical protein
MSQTQMQTPAPACAQLVDDVAFEIFTVDALFEPAELRAWDAYVASAPTDARTFAVDASFKNGKVVDPVVARTLYRRLAPHLPASYVDRAGVRWEFVGPPRHVMYAEVAPGQRFALHTDTGCWFDRDAGEESKFTLLLYLNDGFEGGHTRFYTHDFAPTVTVAPLAGRMLAFDIDLFHEGTPVTLGTKRWIGTEIVCRKAQPA